MTLENHSLLIDRSHKRNFSKKKSLLESLEACLFRARGTSLPSLNTKQKDIGHSTQNNHSDASQHDASADGG